MKHILTLALATGLISLFYPEVSARADGPGYESTIAVIQSGVKGTFSQQDHCSFLAETPVPDGGAFEAGSLSVVPIEISADTVRFECLKGERCVKPASGSGEGESTIGLAVHSDAHGMALAVSRLIEICSGGIH